MTAVSEVWLLRGTALDLWKCAVLWTCFFLSLRTKDLFSTQASWFSIDYHDFWMTGQTKSTKTASGKRFETYLPQLSNGLFDCSFWMKILEGYRADDAIYLLVVPGKPGQGTQKFTSSKFQRYFLSPLNDALQELQLEDPSGAVFTVHSFRYTLASCYTDELGLKPSVAACALKHAQYKNTGSYSKVGQIYQLSLGESKWLKQALISLLKPTKSWVKPCYEPRLSTQTTKNF